MPSRTPKASVNPELLVWARQTANLEHSHIAKACGTSEKAVAAWEEGSDSPTFRQLEDLARKASRPLSALFLPGPPAEPPLPVDFRIRPSGKPGAFKPKTLAAFREARFLAAQTVELCAMLSVRLSTHLPRFSITDNPEAMGAQFRARSGISVEDQLNWRHKYAALDAWRSMLFDLGVLVFQFPMHSGDARGFSIETEEESVGIVGLSTRDDPVARCFSAFHEVCHLCLGEPGVSAGETMFLRRQIRPEERIEAFCDRFAASFLLPRSETQVKHDLERTFDRRTGCDKSEAIEVARKYKVSKYVLLFRAREAGVLPSDLCWTIYREWKEEDERGPDKEGGGGNAVRNRVSARGKRFVCLVFEALDAGRISEHEAMDYLHLHPGHFEKARESAGSSRP